MSMLKLPVENKEKEMSEVKELDFDVSDDRVDFIKYKYT